MATRRRFGRRRFRRSPYDLQTLVECRHGVILLGGSSCASPLVEATLLVGTSTNAVQDSPAQAGVKGFTFGGCHFQAEHALNNATSDVDSGSTAIEIYEAVVVLPYAQGAQGIPAYLPNLSNDAQTHADFADRVLWKRVSLLSFIGLQDNGLVIIDDTYGDEGHGPVIIRSKCTLDERHGLYYVACYTTGFAEGFNVVVERASWWKLAVKERRR